MNFDITHTQKERLAHIEFKAYFHGRVGRNDLLQRFGIKAAAATRDFAKYNEIAPNNLVYDIRAKHYVPTRDFSPIFEYSTSRVLSTLAEGFGDGLKNNQGDNFICENPTQLNEPNLKLVALLSRAVINRNVIEITYCSLSSGETRRKIVPFALVNNGLRMHIRSWDRKRERFTDFVITRIEDPVVLENELVNEFEMENMDEQWNTKVILEIIPHPRLRHKKTIEKDYCMINGVKRVEVRAALAGYLLRRWNVDCSDNHCLTGDEYHLALGNVDSLSNDIDNIMLAPGFNKF
ncbi:MAG: WYL domain-containing protein [Gammaproteobacteria bacterium]|nr:MAG: WYL domain-containing protein [Gammaproteobacteria bacterium]PHR80818.1 MAG: WYL domain-containing protein [Colwellia sp.]